MTGGIILGIFRVGSGHSTVVPSPGSVGVDSRTGHEIFLPPAIVNNVDRDKWLPYSPTDERKTDTSDYNDHCEKVADVSFVNTPRPAPLAPLVLPAHMTMKSSNTDKPVGSMNIVEEYNKWDQILISLSKFLVLITIGLVLVIVGVTYA